MFFSFRFLGWLNMYHVRAQSLNAGQVNTFLSSANVAGSVTGSVSKCLGFAVMGTLGGMISTPFGPKRCGAKLSAQHLSATAVLRQQ